LASDSLGVRPRAFVFRKGAVPAIGEIKDRYVQYEQRVVLSHAPTENMSQSSGETLFFGFHNFVR
jgi:hypothetical protein